MSLLEKDRLINSEIVVEHALGFCTATKNRDIAVGMGMYETRQGF